MNKMNKENEKTVIVYPSEERWPESKSVIIPYLGIYVKNDDSFLYKDALTDYYLYTHKDYIKHIRELMNNYSNGIFKSDNCYTFNGNLNIALTVSITGDTVYYCSPKIRFNEDFKKDFKEDLKTGIFYKVTKPIKFEKHLKIPGVDINTNYDNFLNSVKNKPLTYKGLYGKKYQFGIEIETISGYMPKYLAYELFYSAVHDGSLRQVDDNTAYGKEYVTNVLQGDLGLYNLKKLCNELSTRCLVNHQCGIHSHLSGIIFNKETVVLMYYVYQNIQDEVFKMLPKSRRNNQYCRKLKYIDINIDNIKKDYNFYIDFYYQEIIRFLSGVDFANAGINKKTDHPKGHKCAYDHHTARYCWVNFIPAVFDTRKNEVYTIEFRPAPGSTSYIKIKNWLLVCIGLVDVVENYKNFIYNSTVEELTLTNILSKVYDKKANTIIDWVLKRKDKFKDLSKDEETLIENNDYEDNEIDNDLILKNL